MEKVAEILKQKCSRCHEATRLIGPPIKLSDLDSLKTYIGKGGKLFRERIQDDSMPPGGGLTSSEKKALLNYFE